MIFDKMGIWRIIGWITFLAIFTWWGSRNQGQVKNFNPKRWPLLIGKMLGKAKAMDRKQWAKFLAIGLALTLTSLLIVPRIGVLLRRDAGVVVSEKNHPINQTARSYPPWQSFAILGTLLGVIPILEEWLFRDKLLTWIKQQNFRYSTGIALFLSSAAFGAFHWFNQGTTLYSAFPPFFGGLIFGTAYISNGFKQSCFVHILYNEVILILTYVVFFY